MDINRLKNFAQDTRRKLIQQVSLRLDYVLNTDSVELREKTSVIKEVKDHLKENGKDQLVHEVAYTWFNRLVALRYMDVKDYHDIGVKVLTPIEGFTVPQLLTVAKQGKIPEQLRDVEERIKAILTGKLPSSNPENEAYRLLLIGVCNHLYNTLPKLFNKIDKYAELLIPDDLISDYSIVTDIRNGLLVEDCKNIEIIGWIYQYYISEKKDEIFASEEKFKKEEIPIVTQLFTPRWIVKYLVQNTIGKLWLQNNPKSRLKDHMPYYIESNLQGDDYLKIDSVEEITLLDQACGSGHILVYGFELFAKIYEEQGYDPSDIPELIINNNLYGFEICGRATQLSEFVLLMKAREYDRRILSKKVNANILCYKDLTISDDEIKETFRFLKLEGTEELFEDFENMRNATHFGSLIVPKSDFTIINNLLNKVRRSKFNADIVYSPRLDALEDALNSLQLLSKKYHCVVDNPPYLGSRKMNKQLSSWTKINYPDSKIDLMACFMESGLSILKPNGLLGMINQQAWMFLSSYKRMRYRLISSVHIDTLLHLGSKTFPQIGGEKVQNVAFTIRNNKSSQKGSYIRLIDYNSSESKSQKTVEGIRNPKCHWFYKIDQKNFLKISGSQIIYSLSEQVLKLFDTTHPLVRQFKVKRGLDTSENNRYVRFWYEIYFDSINFLCKSIEQAFLGHYKWFPYNKGDGHTKWFGQEYYVIRFDKKGIEILKTQKVSFSNRRYYFKKSVTWSRIGSKHFVARINNNHIFGGAGVSAFSNEDSQNSYYLLLGFLCSKLSTFLLDLINPTLNFTKGDIDRLPFSKKIFIGKVDPIEDLVKQCIEIAKHYYSIHENTFIFTRNNLLSHSTNLIEESYNQYTDYWENKFYQLHKNEEKLNRLFIEIYGLQDELTPDIALDDITILKEETSIVNGELKFNQKKIISQFISYAVGCMFGRYSLDKEGLILASQGETLEDYLSKVQKQETELSYVPIKDNIVPVLNDNYFENDIVSRFYDFLKSCFGEQYFKQNLSFVEKCIGKDIRRYFLTEFYRDHVKLYKKRPIYWMFSSPKGTFKVIVYIHQYTSNTLNQVLNHYLNNFIEKLKARLQTLNHVVESGNPLQMKKELKERENIRLILIELKEYKQVLYDQASERIEIDLDDGILVNYNKFGDALAKVTGLNDKKAKTKVKSFDWIDNKTIK